MLRAVCQRELSFLLTVIGTLYLDDDDDDDTALNYYVSRLCGRVWLHYF